MTNEEVALLDDLTVLEMDLRQCPADLGTKFHPLHCRELAEKAEFRPRDHAAPGSSRQRPGPRAGKRWRRSPPPAEES